MIRWLTACCCLSALLLLGCSREVRERQSRINRISQETVSINKVSDEEMRRYRMKLISLSARQEIPNVKQIKKAKLQLALDAIRGVQKAVALVGIPVVCPTINLTLDKTVQTYFWLETLNKQLEKSTGFSIEVEEDRAGLEYSKDF